MADTSVDITPGSGKSIDTRTESTNGNHRQVIVIGDPSVNGGVAPVDADHGLSIDLRGVGGTDVDTNSGNKSAGTLRVVVATDQPNVPINIAGLGGNSPAAGGSGNGIFAVGGAQGHNVAISGNPQNMGAQAVSSENAAATTARNVQLVADLNGKLIVLPYANPENFVSGVTSAMTATTSTSLISAPASGLRNYITHIIGTNSHATVGTFINIQDGSGGTVLYSGYAAAVGGGFSITFPTPLRQPTTATALYVVNVTTGSNTVVAASGYIGK